MKSFLALASIVVVIDAYSFITLGDWGGAALEEPSKPYAQNVKDVSRQMSTTAAAIKPAFVINTGDNFYWCGIQNITDFQIQKDWVEPFQTSKDLQVPWFGVLGNHEYGYNVTAQLDMTNKYTNWVLPARYYTKRIQLSDSKFLSTIFLDSNPCVTEYRASNPAGWDPCDTEYPTCSLSGGKDDFEGACLFNQQILEQDCGVQYKWFETQLAKVPKGDWLIVSAHHPADDMDVEDFTSLLQKHGFDLYLNGHTHTLSQYNVDGSGAYVTSGAGSLVLSHDQLGGSPLKDRTMHKANGLQEQQMATAAFGANATAGKGGHTYHSIFNKKTSGFTLHTFNADFSELKTDFLDTNGNTIHTFTVSKGVAPSPSPPSPSPPSPSPPSPSGQCCYFHSTTCSSGDICCTGSGKSYSSASSCSKYGEVHKCKWTGSECVVG